MVVLRSRRAFLGQAAAVLGAAGSGMNALADTPQALHAPRILTAWMRGEQSWAGIFRPGQTPRGIVLPARAHQLLVLPASGQHPRQALVLARRPGEYLLRMDPLRNQALQWHTMEEDRYLGGHAALSDNRKTFFTTETNGETGEGLIAERDMQTLEKLREFPSGGIGPHALLLEPSGSLIVANGGILNLPETGRRKLNVSRMDSNLTRLASGSGEILAQYRLDDPFLSLRHMAFSSDGTLGVALQAEHANPLDRANAPALAVLKDGRLQALAWDSATGAPPHWDGYSGDICFAAGRFWVSAPHAGWVASWSVQQHPFQLHSLVGAGPLAANPLQWVVGGRDAALVFDRNYPQPQRLALGTTWDNHATLI